MKAKQLEKNLKGIKTAFKPDSYFGQLKLIASTKLEEGFNKDYLLAGKIAQFISREGEVPL